MLGAILTASQAKASEMSKTGKRCGWGISEPAGEKEEMSAFGSSSQREVTADVSACVSTLHRSLVPPSFPPTPLS